MNQTAIVVDDEPITRMDITGMLRESGYTVLAEGGDGFDAIELCRRHTPDVVVMDIKMPTFDGLSAAGTIIEEDLAGSVVLLTAFSNQEFIQKAKRVGISGYLVKPVDERTLLTTVEIAIAQGERYKQAKAEQTEMRRKLEEHGLIDRAKAVVAKRDGISESEAYAQMRKTAMDKGFTIAEVARMIVGAAGSKAEVERAKKLLMEQYHLSENAAFRRIKQAAEKLGGDITAAAEQILRENGVTK